MFDADELREIGRVAEEFNLLICADEVVSQPECTDYVFWFLTLYISRRQYDCLTFNTEHIRIAALDNFWQRTITIGSAVSVINCVVTTRRFDRSRSL